MKREFKVDANVGAPQVAFRETIRSAVEQENKFVRQSGGRGQYGHVKRGGKIWIRIFPDVPVTKKPLEVRQGKGKGNVEYWVAKIQPGKMLYEMEGVPEELAREAFKLAAAKLPIQTVFVTRTIM